jgi:enoyl-CoA hydratase/methylglutaconyl-CoA hydratase
MDTAVGEVVSALRQGTPQGLRETKAVLNAALLTRIDTEGERLAELSARLFATDESQAAMRAFLDRRGHSSR